MSPPGYEYFNAKHLTNDTDINLSVAYTVRYMINKFLMFKYNFVAKEVSGGSIQETRVGGSKYHGRPQDFFQGWAMRGSEGRNSPSRV